jgi:hypothetical protein
MDYHHVYLRRLGEDALRLFLRDQSDLQVRDRLVAPYLKAGTLVDEGTIVPVSTLAEVRIVRTDHPFDQAYSVTHQKRVSEIDQLNREGGVYFITPGPGHDDMAAEWDNVTSEFLKGRAPGSGAKPSGLIALTNNRLVGGLVVGVVLALIYWLLGIRR